MNIGGVNVIV